MNLGFEEAAPQVLSMTPDYSFERTVTDRTLHTGVRQPAMNCTLEIYRAGLADAHGRSAQQSSVREPNYSFERTVTDKVPHPALRLPAARLSR
jgi:hypothetical protein